MSMNGRGQNSRQRQPNTAGIPRRDRDSERAYNFNRSRQEPSTSCADDIPYEPPSNTDRKRQRDRNRFNQFKSGKMNEKREQKKDRSTPKQKEAAIPEMATQEDAPQDAPLYDSTPFTSGVPYAQEYCQNFDFSGFPPLCRETYQTLTGFNPRLTRDMPYPGFFHSMNTLLQTAIVDSVFEEGLRPIPGYDTRAQDILPTEYVVPGPIYEYLSNISTVMTPGNQEVKVNLPDIMVPQEAYVDEDDAEIPAGTFGPVDDETHNVYETQVCPYTTMRYVVESALDRGREDPRDWDPLPES